MEKRLLENQWKLMLSRGNEIDKISQDFKWKSYLTVITDNEKKNV
jgi:hypothetical protein